MTDNPTGYQMKLPHPVAPQAQFLIHIIAPDIYSNRSTCYYNTIYIYLNLLHNLFLQMVRLF